MGAKLIIKSDETTEEDEDGFDDWPGNDKKIYQA